MGSHSSSNLEKPQKNANVVFAKSKSSMQISLISHICSFLSKPANQTWLARNPPRNADDLSIETSDSKVIKSEMPISFGDFPARETWPAPASWLHPSWCPRAGDSMEMSSKNTNKTTVLWDQWSFTMYNLKKWKEDDIKSPTQKIFNEITIDNELHWLHMPCCWSDVDPLLILSASRLRENLRVVRDAFGFLSLGACHHASLLSKLIVGFSLKKKNRFVWK